MINRAGPCGGVFMGCFIKKSFQIALMLTGICSLLQAQDLRPKEIVSKVCEKEFSARYPGPIEERVTYVVYSHKRAVKEKRNDPEFSNKVIDTPSSALVVVSTFAISVAVVYGSSATVKVIFDRLAHTRGFGAGTRKIVKETRRLETVDYQLVKVNGKWL
jgi:hypothetical protein